MVDPFLDIDPLPGRRYPGSSMTITVSTALPARRITRVEYERLTGIGFFHPYERLELLDGLLVVREPQKSLHATAVRLVLAALRGAFREGWQIDSQLPIALDDFSEPEPDVAMVRGGPRDGWRYRAVERLSPPATVTPLAAPAARIPVADLLP